MYAQPQPDSIEPAFTLDLNTADALTDEMIDALPPCEAFALEYTLLYIEKNAAEGESTDPADYKAIYDHALFTARVATGDPKAVELYNAHRQYEAERPVAIAFERALINTFYSQE